METGLTSNAVLLETISNATSVPLQSMAVVDSNNKPLKRASRIGDGDVYRPVRIGFTTAADAANVRSAIAAGLVPHVRLPATPTESSGLSQRDKIVIGCTVGIGVPFIILIIVLVCCSCRRRGGGLKGNRSDGIEFSKLSPSNKDLIDLDINTTRLTTAPTVPIKQQGLH
ncbi:hypothetical protein DQ04_13001010 [Trypanosoma grayi]|uniref:hypothetical protein n=1 Tax=Trypanosoma grayi TaxID=71804 RepID=UPI0004F43F81|nr:hypothetical protein DQ04_13001010 [Trypanosoma grayi]KEG06629.1 hypothetical protein DQ04_13001010 [Trypanosoma grayi]